MPCASCLILAIFSHPSQLQPYRLHHISNSANLSGFWLLASGFYIRSPLCSSSLGFIQRHQHPRWTRRQQGHSCLHAHASPSLCYQIYLAQRSSTVHCSFSSSLLLDAHFTILPWNLFKGLSRFTTLGCLTFSLTPVTDHYTVHRPSYSASTFPFHTASSTAHFVQMGCNTQQVRSASIYPALFIWHLSIPFTFLTKPCYRSVLPLGHQVSVYNKLLQEQTTPTKQSASPI